MIRFQTESGSVYELDTANKRVRRIGGVRAPTPRQGADGGWRAYEYLPAGEPAIGGRFAVAYNVGGGVTGGDEGTLTSPVTMIVEVVQ